MSAPRFTPRRIAALSGAVHVAVGLVVVGLTVAGVLPAQVCVAVLVFFGGVWSGVGATVKVSGSPVAATGPKGGTMPPAVAPTSAFMEGVNRAGQ